MPLIQMTSTMRFFRFHWLRFMPIAGMAMLGVAVAAAATPPLPAFTAHYQLLRNGNPIGEATLTLHESGDGAWTFTTKSRGTSGLAGLLGAGTDETSVFHWVGNLPQCDSYDYQLDAGWKHEHRTVHCDWNRHTIVVNDKGTHTFATQPGVLERHTVPLALAAGLAAGQHDFDLPVAVRDRIEIQHYVAQAKTTLRVPLGTFDAIRVTRTDGGDAFEAWFAPDKLPVPVRIDQRGKSDYALELENWSQS